MTLISRTKIEDMIIGDMIPCRYTATSGVAGYFSELGTCISAEIQVTGTPTPDGLFYFIKVDKGLLIADRVVQTGISWDVLNATGYICGFVYRVPLTIHSVSSNYSDGGGWMTGNPLVTIPKKSGTWYTANWAPSDADTAPTVIVKLPTNMDVSKVCITAGNGTIVLNNTVTISTALVSTGPYTTAISAPIKEGVTTYTFPVTNALYIKISFLKTDRYGYNTILMNDIRITTENVIRSLSGGNAYLGTDGKASLTDKGLGAWPINNEWDKYIVNSDLGGKIVAGDDNVWHWKSLYTQCADTIQNGAYVDIKGHTSSGNSSQRVSRGNIVSPSWDNFNWLASNLVPPDRNYQAGFRPVLEYPEDPRCTNIWY